MYISSEKKEYDQWIRPHFSVMMANLVPLPSKCLNFTKTLSVQSIVQCWNSGKQTNEGSSALRYRNIPLSFKDALSGNKYEAKRHLTCQSHDAVAWRNRMTPTVVSHSDVRNMCANRRHKNRNHAHVSGPINLYWANTCVIKHHVLCTAQGTKSNQNVNTWHPMQAMRTEYIRQAHRWAKVHVKSKKASQHGAWYECRQNSHKIHSMCKNIRQTNRHKYT